MNAIQERATMAGPAPSNRFFWRLACALFAVAGIAFLAQAVLALILRNELTQVESIIAIQSRSLAEGGGLYTDLNSYPYTISPYGPIFYAASALLGTLGLPHHAGGRLLSLAAFVTCIWLIGVIVRRLTGDRWAAGAGMLLALSTANLVKWGTTAQSDMTACAFAIAAFERYTAWRAEPRVGRLVWMGAFAALAIFTKQSFAAAAAAISILVFLRDRRTGLRFGGLLTAAGIAAALTIDAVTGGYFDHGIRANLNPFSWSKIADHAKYFFLVSLPLVLIVLAAIFRDGRRAISDVHFYFAVAFALLCATAGKMGSDLNYQIESFALLCVAAALALHRLDFFRLCFRSDRGWITLLQLPLLLYIALNITLTARTALERVVRDRMWQAQTARLTKYLSDDRERVLSVEINPLAATGRPIEVEPLIYTDCVRIGLTDPRPVREDLLRAAFRTVILYEDVFSKDRRPLGGEIPTLPPDHLDVIRSRYHLVEQVDGPLVGGVYVYQPKQPKTLSENGSGG